jgi:hypothetical protein
MCERDDSESQSLTQRRIAVIVVEEELFIQKKYIKFLKIKKVYRYVFFFRLISVKFYVISLIFDISLKFIKFNGLSLMFTTVSN